MFFFKNTCESLLGPITFLSRAHGEGQIKKHFQYCDWTGIPASLFFLCFCYLGHLCDLHSTKGPMETQNCEDRALQFFDAAVQRRWWFPINWTNDLGAFDVGKIEEVKFFSTFRDVLVRNPNLHDFVFGVLLNWDCFCSSWQLGSSLFGGWAYWNINFNILKPPIQPTAPHWPLVLLLKNPSQSWFHDDFTPHLSLKFFSVFFLGGVWI